MSEETPNEELNESAAESAPQPELNPTVDQTLELIARIEQLEAEVEAGQIEVEAAQRDRLYAQAELQNFRRRKEEEFAGQQKFVSEKLLKELLPILDNFERAIAAAESAQSFEKLIGGIHGTMKQLSTFMEKAGVKPIETVGKEFDTQFHEAIGVAEGSELPPNTVAEELQKGYLLHDRVLRPALVKVSSE